MKHTTRYKTLSVCLARSFHHTDDNTPVPGEEQTPRTTSQGAILCTGRPYEQKHKHKAVTPHQNNKERTSDQIIMGSQMQHGESPR